MEMHRAIALQEHLPLVADALAWLILAIEFLGAAILVVGLVRFCFFFVRAEFSGQAGAALGRGSDPGRILLARYILMALEVFIVADLLMTLLSLSIQHLAFLALLVLIRSVVSYFLEREIRAIREEPQQ